MTAITFKDDKEELDFYRELKRNTNEMIDEIHDLLGLDKEYPKRLYLMSLRKQELVLLKNAIKNKLKEKDRRKNEN